MLDNKLKSEAIKQLKDAGIDTAELDFWVLSEYCRKNQQADIKELIDRRKRREPISHIIGNREFWSMDFKVNRNTLTPRPDSETLIETALRIIPDRNKKLRIVDFGTGTGCLLLTLLKEFSNSQGIGVDISKEALIVAELNCMNLGLGERAGFINNFWGESLTGKFDLIVSNPPYIKNSDIKKLEPEVSVYEPRIALEGGNDGLQCYRELMPYISRLLADKGTAVIEIGHDQQEALREIALENKLRIQQVVKDLGGNDRCVVITN